jgi:selenocysteine lyase/cysteine desulfurase
MKNEEQMWVLANDLRRNISDLLEVGHADRIVLTPGILVALRMLFSHLQIKRILLTSEEYYGADHFPGATVEIAPCEAIPRLLQKREFDALVASPASWRGVRQPVEELFGCIRKTLGRKAPLLVADHAHAGSIGFPSVERLGADIVCGDLEKWILPPDWNSRVAFLWFRTQRLFARADKVFRPFFLATQVSDVSTLARWVDPDDVLAVSTKLADLGVTAAQLRERHQADMKLARELAHQLHPSEAPETSILWLEGDEPAGETLADLEKLGLVWRPPGQGVRVLCRSDLVAGRAHEQEDRARSRSAASPRLRA